MKFLKYLRKIIPLSVRVKILKSLRTRSLTFSQLGQDLWIYGEAFNEKKYGYFIDIGAHNGIHLSNTYLLELLFNWDGICIEANPKTFKKLKKNRNVKCINACIDRSEGEVNFAMRNVLGGIVDEELDNKESDIKKERIIKLKTKSLKRVLKENQAPNNIDYLSIDVEGAEERILSNFDFNEYSFKCITIERPSERLRKILQANKYVLVKEIPDMDCFYVHKDFLNIYKNNLVKFYKKTFFA